LGDALAEVRQLFPFGQFPMSRDDPRFVFVETLDLSSANSLRRLPAIVSLQPMDHLIELWPGGIEERQRWSIRLV